MKKFLVSSLFCLMGGVFLQGDTVPSVPAQLLPLPPTADVPLVPAVTEQAALPAAAPTVVAASLPSVAVSVTPEPAPLAAAPPMPGMAPINASAIIPSTRAHASASAEADKSSLFVEPSSNGPDSTQRKDMFEKTADDEHKAQDALASIEQSKNERLDAYLAFDAELDALLAKEDWPAATRRIHDQLPYIPLWYEAQFAAFNRNLKGYSPKPDGNWDDLATIERSDTIDNHAH